MELLFGGYMEKQLTDRKNVSVKIRQMFRSNPENFYTLKQLNDFYPDLKPSEISMALCYLLKKSQIEREQIPNATKIGRKNVFAYRIKEAS